MTDINSLVEEAESDSRSGRETWVDRLDDEPREFVDIMGNRFVEGRPVNATSVSKILKREWGFVVAPQTVSTYFRKLGES